MDDSNETRGGLVSLRGGKDRPAALTEDQKAVFDWASSLKMGDHVVLVAQGQISLAVSVVVGMHARAPEGPLTTPEGIEVKFKWGEHQAPFIMVAQGGWFDSLGRMVGVENAAMMGIDAERVTITAFTDHLKQRGRRRTMLEQLKDYPWGMCSNECLEEIIAAIRKDSGV